tara:strand:- start:101 stop:499 length:399 start_codon:yes stop_codon:yes gene_type:complete
MDLEIINIASDTINNKDIKGRTHYSNLKNSMCGDEIKISLIIEGDRIVDFGYEGKSCIYCQASASLLSKISINNHKFKIIELCNDVKSYFESDIKIIKGKWKPFDKLLKDKNKPRKECILLPFKAVEKIITN